ncbi:uncharacterized protein LOC131213592 [Anopheles bellator]|uniref:uncharacterized protein LOC131213592 n=1 Tax=Anopheles bellator TaxID=139047 RepID=UPI002647BD7E|nr:uncharacterized protein LOC131213592 [Anopheles bellator]
MYKRKVAIYCALAYIICMLIITTNSRTSTLWKLNSDEGKIVSVYASLDRTAKTITSNLYKVQYAESENDSEVHYGSLQKQLPTYLLDEDEESTFHIITTTANNFHHNRWSRQSTDSLLVDVAKNTVIVEEHPQLKTRAAMGSNILDCGKPVNFTYYDDMIGIAQRHNHPIIPEPEVACLFLKKKGPKSFENFNIDALERQLRKAKKRKPHSVKLYSQIGNFWRIKGDARLSIECFRSALAIDPTNAEVLFNLARVLYNLQYLDDAIHLTKRSLEVQPKDRSAWQQYFTLGEIFKAYGHFQESVNHLRQALELYPQYEPIKRAIADVENISRSSLHIFTIIIIAFLVLSVLYVIISSNDSSQNNPESGQKKKRHFNRAMAMRSLKGYTQRSSQNRKKNI